MNVLRKHKVVSLILACLISLGCQTKIEHLPTEIPPECPILDSIDTDKTIALIQIDPDTIERLFKNTQVLMASLGCDYTDPDQWRF